MTNHYSLLFVLWATLAGLMASVAARAGPSFELPRTGITGEELAIVVNDNDPVSREIAAYYQAARAIPARNVVHVSIPTSSASLTRQQTQTLLGDIASRTPSHIEAYALAWTRPYRADCMSMTSAVALGFDEKYCSTGCGTTADSGYFDAYTSYPYSVRKIRPAMLLAGQTPEQIKALIDRGIAADSTFPDGTAYLLSTSDRARNARAPQFDAVRWELDGVFPLAITNADSIAGHTDVLFYFTGLARVPNLETLRFMPGALADHLTSTGGDLFGSHQMSSLRWLEAGATASYGTVVEPCNHPQKFPAPAITMKYYASGATALEAYWKSVAWPGQGVFIGEPLAKPFAPRIRALGDRNYELTVFSLQDAIWQIDIAAEVPASFRALLSQPVHRGKNVLQFRLPAEGAAIVRARPR